MPVLSTPEPVDTSELTVLTVMVVEPGLVYVKNSVVRNVDVHADCGVVCEVFVLTSVVSRMDSVADPEEEVDEEDSDRVRDENVEGMGADGSDVDKVMVVLMNELENDELRKDVAVTVIDDVGPKVGDDDEIESEDSVNGNEAVVVEALLEIVDDCGIKLCPGGLSESREVNVKEVDGGSKVERNSDVVLGPVPVCSEEVDGGNGIDILRYS